MHSAPQRSAVTIISYKLLSDLIFVRSHTTLWQLHALFSFGVYKPLLSLINMHFNHYSEDYNNQYRILLGAIKARPPN